MILVSLFGNIRQICMYNPSLIFGNIRGLELLPNILLLQRRFCSHLNMENNEVRAATETVKKSEMLDIRLVLFSRSTFHFPCEISIFQLVFSRLTGLLTGLILLCALGKRDGSVSNTILTPCLISSVCVCMQEESHIGCCSCYIHDFTT